MEDDHALLADGWAPYSDYLRLSRACRRLRGDAAAISGYGFRFVEPKWAAEPDRLSGAGAKQFGGRWNPAGLAALYFATSPAGATAETFASANSYGFQAEHLTPRVIFACRLHLTIVLDLTQGTTRQRLRVSDTRMMSCPWQRSRAKRHEHLTQAIGRAAASAGFQAVLVPSSTSGDPNVVVFPEHVPGRRIQVVHPDEF